VYRAEIYDEEVWNEWVYEEGGLPLFPTLGLFNQLKAANVGVVFLTGRPESQRNATSSNLNQAGYHGWIDLFLR
jgi:predicted secreted acid phosphatase